MTESQFWMGKRKKKNVKCAFYVNCMCNSDYDHQGTHTHHTIQLLRWKTRLKFEAVFSCL